MREMTSGTMQDRSSWQRGLHYRPLQQGRTAAPLTRWTFQSQTATIFQKHRLLTHITGTVLIYTASISIICRRQPQRHHLPIPLQMTGQPQRSTSIKWIRKQEKRFRRETQLWRALFTAYMPATTLYIRTGQRALSSMRGILLPHWQPMRAAMQK